VQPAEFPDIETDPDEGGSGPADAVNISRGVLITGALTIIAPAREGLSAIITVHEADCDRRVFVDVVSEINDGDFKTFEEKTDQIYSIAKKQVIVTLVSYGGRTDVAMQIGSLIRKRGMSTNTATARSGEHR
jgi:hypothetical protein